MGPPIQTITIPDPFSTGGLEIEVRRPDFARILTTIYDYSGLTYEVRQIFGEVDYSPAPGKKGSDDDKQDHMIEMLDDLIARTLVSPTYAEFEEHMPLDNLQKGEIIEYLREEIKDLRDLIRDKDRAMMVCVQCKKAKKEAADVIDPYFTLSGVARVAFNRAMAEYLLFLEDDKKPTDYNNSNRKVKESPVDFLQSVGVGENGKKVDRNVTGLDNTMALMMKAAEKSRKG